MDFLEFPKRKNIRLNGYDYSSNGMYFITICSHQRDCIFGQIINNKEPTVVQGLCSCNPPHQPLSNPPHQPLSNPPHQPLSNPPHQPLSNPQYQPSCQLSNIGMIIKNEILDLKNRYPNIKIDKYVIMPNHIHLIIIIENNDVGYIRDNRQDDWKGWQDDWKGWQDDWKGWQDDWKGRQDDWKGRQDDWKGRQDDWKGWQDDWKGRQEQSPCPTIGDVVCALKSISTKKANAEENLSGRKIWQFRFHDHIIRNEEAYQKIWKYIDENPLKWKQDRFHN